MSIVPNSSLFPLFILYLCFHEGKDVTRKILRDREGSAQGEVHMELDWYLSLCSVLKGAKKHLAFI